MHPASSGICTQRGDRLYRNVGTFISEILYCIAYRISIVCRQVRRHENLTCLRVKFLQYLTLCRQCLSCPPHPKVLFFTIFDVCPVATVLHNLINRCVLVVYPNDLTNAAPCYVRHLNNLLFWSCCFLVKTFGLALSLSNGALQLLGLYGVQWQSG